MFMSIKRLFQVLACLALLGGFSLTALYNYINTNAEVQARLKLSVEDAETKVDKEAGFLEKTTALAVSWWESDELVAEAQQDKVLRDDSKKKQAERERDRAFNENQHSSNDDYYGSSQ